MPKKIPRALLTRFAKSFYSSLAVSQRGEAKGDFKVSYHPYWCEATTIFPATEDVPVISPRIRHNAADNTAALFFIDRAPSANWGHSCAYVLFFKDGTFGFSGCDNFPMFQKGAGEDAEQTEVRLVSFPKKKLKKLYYGPLR